MHDVASYDSVALCAADVVQSICDGSDTHSDGQFPHVADSVAMLSPVHVISSRFGGEQFKVEARLPQPVG